MRIIPAIDIINGKCVRLTKGDYATQKTYNENPVAVARSFEDAGIKYLHLIDLDGAKSGSIVNHKVLESIATQTNLIIDFGGGVKSDTDIQKAFEYGASQVTAGSIAVKNPEKVTEWLSQYGSDKIILGADCNNRKIAVNAWLQESDTDVLEFIQGYQKKGIKTVICTDIAKDGMLQGPSTNLYKEIIGLANINLIASGGITNIQDVLDMKAIGCEGAIIGKALYEGKIELKELSKLC
ncbi:1-(5-phosphoribosyl)-5-[(5-phosphoribosylamino)methylideneamino]imidazole-4-carboxamide isomerase [Flavobacterium rakeshii]|uniref:1-(5-phosphoribosyl)-5-[(5-phosphoribosylamino)methylideneamino] imidazole-4-carboxamide isomerase n=1 Tax=Flavobacterium rakeshii TaxID=1038845 RepID=A0A6N8HB70_9FLAO|nr:1-(5-phosphoribosyl)-5-[(5-phosphoribosylamino)methylideneamino]imidazole-4-carboxamide isomerase [Flavobacterium rakeshii]MEE1898543.1 1-(5-phosphoribosyl)-5-[(5-phosphoribosylamino)methylideneamino]imidazole-4-carboxamide isomerase [Flavobacterium rakeshii]MUV02815.1 1-(5-phosphoribosyl)-5-[(5-phosphoribosylamino)methylideneamino]imidazole-4-carboxamide isomerase [Flavobacterium rakeshii]